MRLDALTCHIQVPAVEQYLAAILPCNVSTLAGGACMNAMLAIVGAVYNGILFPMAVYH